MTKVVGIYAFEFDFVEFGIDVKEVLDAAGIKQKQLAEWCEVHPTVISAIVTGAKGSSYTIDTFTRICNVCDLHPGDYWSLKSQPITKFQE